MTQASSLHAFLQVLADHALLGRLFFASVEMAALAGIVWLIIRIRRRASPRLCSILWLLVMAKALVALAIGAPLAIIRIYRPEPEPLAVTYEPGLDYEDRVPSFELEPTLPLVTVEPGPTEPAPPARWSFTWKWSAAETISGAWIIGAILVALYAALNRVRLHRLVSRAMPPPTGIVERYRAAVKHLRVSRPPRLLVTHDLESPALVGTLAPAILLPAWMSEKPNDAQLDWSLRHELTHWKLGDPLADFLRQIARILFFFHPVTWFASRKWEESAELACDRVLVRTESEAESYAGQLYQILAQIHGRRMRPAMGGLFATRTQIGRRIAALLSNPLKSPARLGVLATLCVLALATLSLAVGGAFTGTRTLAAEDVLQQYDASSSDAKSQIIAALESNLSKIEDASLEYTATTTNKGAKEPLFIEHYAWALKGNDQRLSYRESDGWHIVEVRSETKLFTVREKYGAPREIGIEDFEPVQVQNLSYMRANISGFLFNDLAPSSFLKMLQSTKATFDIVGNTGIVEMADVPGRTLHTTLQVDLDKGLVLSSKITVEGSGFAEFVAKDLTSEDGIWFMKRGVLHRYAHKEGGNGKLYSENTQDVLVEIRDLHFNAGLSDSLFAVIPQPGDGATVKMDGIWVDYFATDEQKQARVVKETERREAIERLQGKPAPALHIRKWVNRKPDTTGKKQVYLFWSKNCGPSMERLQSYDRQYRLLSTYVEVIGIHRTQDAEGLEQLIQDLNIAIPIGVDEDGKTHAGYYVQGWPCSFLIDEDGTFAADMHGSVFIGNFMSVPPELEEQYLRACFGE